MIIPDTAPKISNDKKSLNSRHILPLSFLSRKKKRSACAGSAAPQTDGRRHILRCRRSKYRSGYASLLRLVSARVRRACAPAFPCKLTTQKKVDFRRVFFAAPAVFANVLHKTDGSHTNRPFFPSKQDVREGVFSQINQLSRSVFCFFSSRKEIVPLSFLSRKKKRSACAGSAAPQTDGRRHILRCRRSKYRSGYASLLRLVSARVRRACAPAFPCKPTTQKKVDFRRVFFAAPAVFASLQHKTDGSHTNRPFFVPGRICGKAFSPEREPPPQCLLFLFFKKRKRTPSRKEIVPPKSAVLPAENAFQQ